MIFCFGFGLIYLFFPLLIRLYFPTRFSEREIHGSRPCERSKEHLVLLCSIFSITLNSENALHLIQLFADILDHQEAAGLMMVPRSWGRRESSEEGRERKSGIGRSRQGYRKDVQGGVVTGLGTWREHFCSPGPEMGRECG